MAARWSPLLHHGPRPSRRPLTRPPQDEDLLPCSYSGSPTSSLILRSGPQGRVSKDEASLYSTDAASCCAKSSICTSTLGGCAPASAWRPLNTKDRQRVVAGKSVSVRVGLGGRR